MRSIPSDIASKLTMLKQTRANSADPSASIWIGRPTTPLTTDVFLEKQAVITMPVTDVSIAVCHPRYGSSNTKLYIGYISDGTAHIATADPKARMDTHLWVDTGFSESATDISLAFNGTMPYDRQGKVEFVTEAEPWIFWVSAGVLLGKKTSDELPITLATENCSGVSAVRGSWTEASDFDFGLVVFYILSGAVYYRQLINGVWMDAAPINYGPAVTIVDLAASRTWDYRICLQLQDNAGTMYELFTQYQAIGKLNIEHLDIKSVSAEGGMTEVFYTDTQTIERVEVADVTAGAPYGGLYSVDTPAIVDAYNVPTEIEVEGEIVEDWGRAIVIKFNVHLVASDVASNSSRFALKDSNNVSFTATSATLDADGKTIALTFADFNAADGECQIVYTPGTAYSMASVAIPSTSFSFTPINLNAPDEPAPEVEAIWNE